ncbi:hypothetical protein SAMN02745121_02975 [Nannocystis exedens]|uniref:Outer membrane protein beta-barrel domain-containing protein n=1 Tax=Nannocystis exedens TaxID=54 RepID=A0A1I1XNH5_9BACT|nr:hypothetical protein [Nannocystis exedens]PCC73297.1 hypothetical protein NAEX_06385 [Nannocystis exedens]SFE08876.1 hypothetical protein SAMN02745121_02975 [Nannocystis exedens]
MRWAALLGLSIGLLPAPVEAETPDLAWRERQAMSGFRGYLRVDPAALVLADYRPGAAIGGSFGAFRAIDGFAAAFGGRVGYAMVDRQARGFDRTLHLSPELRLGAVSPRAFGYVLLRGGYSHRFEIPRPAFGGPADGYHYGLGAGIWTRVGKRFLFGFEGAVDMVQFKGRGVAETLFLSLTFGSWL